MPTLDLGPVGFIEAHPIGNVGAILDGAGALAVVQGYPSVVEFGTHVLEYDHTIDSDSVPDTPPGRLLGQRFRGRKHRGEDLLEARDARRTDLNAVQGIVNAYRLPGRVGIHGPDSRVDASDERSVFGRGRKHDGRDTPGAGE
jgi:hypothetical protein